MIFEGGPDHLHPLPPLDPRMADNDLCKQFELWTCLNSDGIPELLLLFKKLLILKKKLFAKVISILFELSLSTF